MTEQEDMEFGAKIFVIANATREAVLLGNKKIEEAIEASPYDEYELESLIEFANLFMQGYEKEYIIDRLQISPELVERVDKHNLCW